METSQKVAIVTGGGSGIGRAICSELVSRNIFVIIADIDESAGESVEWELNKVSIQSRFVYLDVTNYKNVEQVFNDIYKEFNRLDYVFNNAGIAMYGELSDMSMEEWEDIMNINVWGVVYGTQIGYSIMKKQGFGHLVNTASAAGLGPSPISSAYSTTKHAVVGLTKSLHYEAEAYGVKVSTLCPAFVDTPIFDKAKAIKIDKVALAKQLKKQKMMSPQQIAKISIHGVHNNKPVICPMPMRKTMNFFFALFPPLHRALMRLVCKVSREARIES